MDSFTTHLNMLIQLAFADNDFSEKEKRMIYTIGKANKIKESEIDHLINLHLSKKDVKLEFQALTEDERFEFLYNIVQLMKIDNEVFLSEIRFCERMAEKLNYKKTVVREVSSKIYADPTITADRTMLKDLASKYRLN